MKVLTLSGTPWNDNNSFGNSYSNIFEGIDDLKFANIYCGKGSANGKMVVKSFQISLNSLIRNLINPNNPAGQEVGVGMGEEASSIDVALKSFGRKHRFRIFFFAIDFVWKIGKWNSPELKTFIDDFQADILFVPVYFDSYLNDVLHFIKNYTQLPMIGYISDDCYTLKQFSLSPLYWIERLYKRRKVKQTIEQCEILYVISDVQKREYEKIFTPECKILTKCADFSDSRKPAFKEPGEIFKMIYAGNISKGRYEILAELAKAVERLNADRKQIEFDIYTLTPLNESQKKVLSTVSVHLHPPVSYNEIREIQEQSDILVHVEGFSLKERLAVHQSFSTKIVDYLETNRCIFAIGHDYCSSIQYFIKNKCGAVATNKEEIEKKLTELCNDRTLLKKYADNAWKSGKNYHEKSKIQSMLIDDIEKVIKRNESVAN